MKTLIAFKNYVLGLVRKLTNKGTEGIQKGIALAD